MKILVTGTRGIPDILGGVETHCEQLYPRIVGMEHEVVLVRRACYVADNNRRESWKGVKLIDINTPRHKSLEAVVHTFRAVLLARKLKPDILHIHAVGPSLLVPLAKLFRLNVVTTNHGPDYNREKWKALAKFALRTGERFSALYSDAVIAISRTIADSLKKLYGRIDTDIIFNGTVAATPSENTDYLEQLGLKPGAYVVGLARFVPEKNLHHLVEAFVKAGVPGFKLAIAGDADHDDEYSRSLKELAKQNGVVLTGFIKGEKLRQIMSGAALFVLPSSHEGLPISLLEAMGYGLDVVASDIPANRLDELRPDDFFPCGDIDALADKISLRLANPKRRSYDLSRYNWDNIARQTLEVYKRVASKNS